MVSLIFIIVNISWWECCNNDKLLTLIFITFYISLGGSVVMMKFLSIVFVLSSSPGGSVVIIAQFNFHHCQHLLVECCNDAKFLGIVFITVIISWRECCNDDKLLSIFLLSTYLCGSVVIIARHSFHHCQQLLVGSLKWWWIV